MDKEIINKYITQINDIYKEGFFQQYGIDLVISLIIVYIFGTIITYFYVINHIPAIKANWPENKCKPFYIPLAGFIINDPTKSKLELGAENFTGCVQSILVSVVAIALEPIYYALHVLTKTIEAILDAIDSIRALINRVRESIREISENITGRILNVSLPLVKFIIVIRNIIANLVGTLTATLYSAIGGYLVLKSTLGAVFQIILGYVIVPLVASIIIAFALWPLGLLAAIPLIAILTLILIIYIPANTVVSELLNIPVAVIPSY